jgi:hypothetical protein
MFALGHDPTKFAGLAEARTRKFRIVYADLEKVDNNEVCHYTLVPCGDGDSLSSAEGEGAATLEPPSPVFMHLGTGPLRAA